MLARRIFRTKLSWQRWFLEMVPALFADTSLIFEQIPRRCFRIVWRSSRSQSQTCNPLRPDDNRDQQLYEAHGFIHHGEALRRGIAAII